MNIAVHLANRLISQAVCQLLLKMGNAKVATSGKRPAKGFIPDVLLVDIATLGQELLTRYPTAKVLFIDTGIPREKLCATLLSYRVHGVLSLNMERHVLKKALKTVSKGQISDRQRVGQGFLPRHRGHLQAREGQRRHRQGTGGHRVHLPGVEQPGDRPATCAVRKHGEGTPQQNLP